jgi:hypothetical protein
MGYPHTFFSREIIPAENKYSSQKYCLVREKNRRAKPSRHKTA